MSTRRRIWLSGPVSWHCLRGRRSLLPHCYGLSRESHLDKKLKEYAFPMKSSSCGRYAVKFFWIWDIWHSIHCFHSRKVGPHPRSSWPCSIACQENNIAILLRSDL